ncbi:MAG: ParB/RepB/Spo0J family partition protein [Thermoanaerobaculia bacterium]|nr:ParB/RepB/Spo0J family partition protein [Thermoanaerobaculia bacterium]
MSEATATTKRGLPLRVKMRHGAHFVDELASRNESTVGRLLPLSSLRPNPNQPRTDVGDLADLVASIRDKGVLEPILVRKNDHGEGLPPGVKFEIVAGERRYRAALEAGLFEIPAIELDVTADEALEITLIENLQRKDLNAFEEAEGYQALGTLHSYTQEQIAQAVGRSRSSIAESLGLLTLPREVRERALELGISAKSALLELAKVTDPKALEALLARAGREGLSRDDLRSELRKGPAARGGSARKRPFAFKFRAPDKSFQLQLQFRQSTVEKSDLIRALEQILDEIRSTPEA